MAILDSARLALRVQTDAYDSEIVDLIEAAKLDLGVAGVEMQEGPDKLVERAIITYVKIHFGDLNKDDAERLQASYDAQKGALANATGYTNWEG